LETMEGREVIVWSDKGHDQKFQYNSGGSLREAGRDCVIRSISIVTGRNYHSVYTDLQTFAKTLNNSKRERGDHTNLTTGVHIRVWKRYLKQLGFKYVSTMKIGQGTKVHLRGDELPKGKLIVSVSRHLTAVIDGVIHDTFDPSRNGKRCVFSYFIMPHNPKPKLPEITNSEKRALNIFSDSGSISVGQFSKHMWPSKSMGAYPSLYLGKLMKKALIKRNGPDWEISEKGKLYLK
jgi:hypothetical protein